MRKTIFTAALLLLTALSAEASVTELSIEKDQSSNLIKISGSASPNESVGVQILPGDISISEFAESDVKNDIVTFVYEDKADSNGGFSFDAVIKKSGSYKLYTASEDVNVPVRVTDFVFYTSDEYAKKIALLNNAGSESEFINTALEYKEVFGFTETTADTADIKDTLTLMYKELGGKKLDQDSYSSNNYLYRNAYAVVALNKKKLDDIYPNIKNIIEEDATLKKYWEQYITDTDREKYLSNKISGKAIESIDRLKSRIKEGLILTATRYPNGYMSLKGLYSDYKDILGLSSVSSDSSVYSALASKDYADIADLRNAYNSAAAGSGGSGGSGGGGGGGGGSSSSSGGGTKISSTSPINSVEVIQEAAATDPIDLKFLDLTTYEWAYPSISRLFKEGIIDGISDQQFAPSKQVKREEFVKMIVCAMRLEQADGDAFEDVASGAWYAPYVYAAYNNSVVNGISQSEFGVSLDISRQDMACMIYNAIKLRGYEPATAEIVFDDKDSISDYAQEAVAQLVSLEIINGIDDNRFAPKENATRAQAAVIIDRALQYLR